MTNIKSPLYIQYQCFLILLILHCFTAARAITPDEQDNPLENASDTPDLPLSTPSPEGHHRQKSSAALLSFKPSAFLAKISVSMSQATADVISDVPGHYIVPDGDQAAGVEDTGWYRAGLKLLLLPFLLFGCKQACWVPWSVPLHERALDPVLDSTLCS